MRNYLCALPPKQHPTANAEPDGSADKIASEQMDKCLEPRGNGEAKGEPIEQHHEHEEYRYRPHFPYPFTDTECCTSEIRQTRRSMFDKTRPRPLPPAASTTQRPRLEASFSS